MTTYCTFSLDEQLYGMDIENVQEVISPESVTPVPLAPPRFGGLINLRGQILLTMDLRSRLGLAPRDGDAPRKTVVMRTSEGFMGLQVDKMGDVVESGGLRPESLPFSLQGAVREVATHVFMLSDRLMIVLDPERLE